jgi:hypothetical protein
MVTYRPSNSVLFLTRIAIRQALQVNSSIEDMTGDGKTLDGCRPSLGGLAPTG